MGKNARADDQSHNHCQITGRIERNVDQIPASFARRDQRGNVSLVLRRRKVDARRRRRRCRRCRDGGEGDDVAGDRVDEEGVLGGRDGAERKGRSVGEEETNFQNALLAHGAEAVERRQRRGQDWRLLFVVLLLLSSLVVLFLVLFSVLF